MRVVLIDIIWVLVEVDMLEATVIHLNLADRSKILYKLLLLSINIHRVDHKVLAILPELLQLTLLLTDFSIDLPELFAKTSGLNSVQKFVIVDI